MNLRKLPKQPSDWYTVKNAANGEPAEVFIYDQIGSDFWSDGVSPAGLIDEIKAMKLKDGDTLSVRINSPGGSMFDGNTIYNYLTSIKQKIEVTVDGMAASAASVIAMAGDVIRMPENSFLMIHNPWMMVAGDAKVMRKTADDLDVMRDGAIKTYLSKARNMKRRDLVKMLDEETWIGADRAVELGFADEVLEPVRVAALARFKLENYFQHIPEPVSRIQNDERNKQAQRRAHIERLKSK